MTDREKKLLASIVEQTRNRRRAYYLNKYACYPFFKDRQIIKLQLFCFCHRMGILRGDSHWFIGEGFIFLVSHFENYLWEREIMEEFDEFHRDIVADSVLVPEVSFTEISLFEMCKRIGIIEIYDSW